LLSTALSLIKLNEKTLADKDVAKVPSIQLFAALLVGPKATVAFNSNKAGYQHAKTTTGKQASHY